MLHQLDIIPDSLRLPECSYSDYIKIYTYSFKVQVIKEIGYQHGHDYAVHFQQMVRDYNENVFVNKQNGRFWNT